MSSVPCSEGPDQISANENMGRGQREKKLSVLLNQYVVYSAQASDKPSLDFALPSKSYGTSFYPLSKYMSCHRLSLSMQSFVATVIDQVEPTSYKEAVKHEVWRNAMKHEIVGLEEKDTWDVVDLPPDKEAIGCKWVYKIKFNSDGTIERHKGRVVAYGNNQEEGIDYSETFAPVVKMTTMRIVLEVAAAKGWELYQMDVHNAFLHGDLEEEVYMRLPPGYSTPDDKRVCRLKKSIYGLRQSPRCWFSKLSKALLEFGFKQNYKDYSLFTLTRGSRSMFVLVYVDDLIVGGNDSNLINLFKSYLSRCFHMKDLGVLRYFLGIEVSRGKEGIYLSQRNYALDIINECGLLGTKPAPTLMEQNHNLAWSDGAFYTEPAKYRRLVGCLVYLAITKPEISYAVYILAQFLQKPRQHHWDAAIRLVRYLKGVPGRGILLSANNDLHISAFCDSDWAACPLTRRSLTGFIFILGDSMVSWKTKKQHTSHDPPQKQNIGQWQ